MATENEKGKLVRKVHEAFAAALMSDVQPVEASLFLQAVLDLLDFSTHGSLWDNNWSQSIGPDEDNMPYGTFVNLIPVHGSDMNHFKAMFTFSRSEENPQATAALYIEGEKTSRGYQLQEVGYDAWDLSEKQLLFGIAVMGFNAAADFR